MGESLTTTLQDQTRSVLTPLLQRSQPVALLDYPQHFNAGDTLIYRGEMSYAAELSDGVKYICTRRTYDKAAMTNAVPHGPLLLHGGGNFGDRYAAFQLFREQVIADNPDRTVIQMPQTMEFRDKDALARTQRLYAQHPNLTLLMRDTPGYEKAVNLFPDNRVLFCPDAAFGAGYLEPTATASHEYVVLKRKDSESVHGKDALPRSLVSRGYVCDWHATIVDNLKWWPATWFSRSVHRLRPVRQPVTPALLSLYEQQADIILRNAISIISRGNVVVTDRLHAAVFGILMRKPVVMVDNANKKLSLAYKDYLQHAPDVYLATDFGEATEIAARIAV
ncbi:MULTISPECIES: polysaccharide pyruvyl transferase family protein [Actinomycetes]|uniref:polysaccharide pyruvyl transferase family protein n=1 Tax=Actinomycetes TaxID=1760 RepID=UPI0004BF554E|nr:MULTISPECIES: polysaccharide pyruvyl transferase family protein [Actinomycetes]